MHALIVINGYKISEGVQYQISRLLEEGKKRDIEFDIRKNTDILVYLNHGHIVSNLPSYDFVMYLDKDQYVSKMLEKAGYRLFNNSDAIHNCDDKMLTHIMLANKGICMPKTISNPLCFSDDGNRDIIANVERELPYPFIIKENFGSLGKQVYLIKNHDEFVEKENELIHTNHIYQQFIKTSKGMDYRLIVIGNKVVATMKRENKNSYLSNAAQGGTCEKIELPENYIETAEAISKILNLDYCGVDILKGTDNIPVVSEVNSNAFFTNIEKVTNVNVAGLYLDHIIKLIKPNFK